MKAKYLGHPSDIEGSPRVVQHCGVTFPRGEWATLPDLSEQRLEKLKANPSFEVAEGKGGTFDAPPAPEFNAVPGEKPAKQTKAQITAELDEMKVEYDPKASATALAAILEDAKFAAGD